MLPRIQTLATQYKPRLYGWEPRWNDLRRIGNSSIARASVAVPVLGYLILFHSDLINYLKLHSSFCNDCTVSWRIYALYFACCCFAVGSVIYAIWCPQLIKSYQTSREFFEAEKTYFCDGINLEYLFHLFERENKRPADPYNLATRAKASATITAPEMTQLSSLMGQFYFIQNRKAFSARVAVYIAYALGFLSLGIPAVLTFVEILKRASGH